VTYPRLKADFQRLLRPFKAPSHVLPPFLFLFLLLLLLLEWAFVSRRRAAVRRRGHVRAAAGVVWMLFLHPFLGFSVTVAATATTDGSSAISLAATAALGDREVGKQGGSGDNAAAAAAAAVTGRGCDRFNRNVDVAVGSVVGSLLLLHSGDDGSSGCRGHRVISSFWHLDFSQCCFLGGRGRKRLLLLFSPFFEGLSYVFWVYFNSN
jgi:hypothetical protein